MIKLEGNYENNGQNEKNVNKICFKMFHNIDLRTCCQILIRTFL